MEELTPRQAYILKALIEEYIQTAEPVGSDTLEKKYNLGVSPATIRNEMATLSATGYLRQPHTSSGRVPTSKALHFYVRQLMEEKQLTLAEEVKARQRIEEAKGDFDHLMKETTSALAQETKTLAVGALEEFGGECTFWHAGYANILEMPEFYNIDVTSRVLSMLEEVGKLRELLFERTTGDLAVIFGDELGWPYFDSVGVVISKFQIGKKNGSIGIIGSVRLPFPYVIPRVRYFGGLLSQIGAGV